MKKRSLVALFLIFILLIAAAGYKVHRVFQNPLFLKADDRGVFWTEGALHYRWAKMAAQGEGIPRWDQRIQWPEGLYPYQEETPVMELVAGTLYRWLPLKIPFHQFVLIFNCVWSTLTVAPLFGVALLLCGNLWISFLCAALYAFSIANLSAHVSGGFVRENFALVFIFAHFYFLMLSMTRPKIKWGIVSGIFLYLSLLSWHLAQFYFALLVLFMAGAYLWNPIRNQVSWNWILLLGFAFLGGATIPSLLKGGYLLSYSSMIGLALLLGLFFFPQRWGHWPKRILFCVAALLFCSLPHWIGASHLQEFSHVYQFLLTKISTLGYKPANPELLSYEGKIMWMSSFETPSWKMVWDFFILTPFLALPAVAGALHRAAKRNLELAPLLLLYFCAAFAFLYWLMIRMDCFLIFFLSALIALPPALAPERIRSYLRILGLLLLLGFIFNFYKLTQSRIREVTPPLPTLFDLYQKIDVFTLKDDPILTPFPLGPSVAASTGRPVIIHSKFENAAVRHKVKEFEYGFFDEEEKFYQLCQKYGARYVVMDVAQFLDLSTESVRYRTNNMKASRHAVLYKMHFAPQELRRFKLITSNEDYRLYRVLKEGESRMISVPSQPGIYDIRNFTADQLQLSD